MKKENYLWGSYGSKCGCCKKSNDPYMVVNYLWKKYSNGHKFMCLQCFEISMGRPFELDDFKLAPINQGCFGFVADVFLDMKEEIYKLKNERFSVKKHGPILEKYHQNAYNHCLDFVDRPFYIEEIIKG